MDWLHEFVWALFVAGVVLTVATAVAEELEKKIGEVAGRLADFDSKAVGVGFACDRLVGLVLNMIRRFLSKNPEAQGDESSSDR